MGLGTEDRTHAEKGNTPSTSSSRKPSRLSNLMANVGHIDSRTLIYVLLIIVACALVIVAISAMSQTFLAQPSTASSFARHH
jgi:hypothetical protein